MKKYREFLKSILIVLIIQSAMYYLIKLVINDYNTISSIINFPLVNYFVYFYDSWYPFVFIISFVIYINNKELYYKLIFSLIISSLMAHITFIIYPTILVRPNIEINSLTNYILDFTYKTDNPPVNCLPSVHCIFCFVLMYYTYLSNFKYKYPTIIYFFLIVLSTLFIHQHIIEDVILSLIYSIISIILVKLFYDKLKKILNFIF